MPLFFSLSAYSLFSHKDCGFGFRSAFENSSKPIITSVPLPDLCLCTFLAWCLLAYKLLAQAIFMSVVSTFPANAPLPGQAQVRRSSVHHPSPCNPHVAPGFFFLLIDDDTLPASGNPLFYFIIGDAPGKYWTLVRNTVQDCFPKCMFTQAPWVFSSTTSFLSVCTGRYSDPAPRLQPSLCLGWGEEEGEASRDR